MKTADALPRFCAWCGLSFFSGVALRSAQLDTCCTWCYGANGGPVPPSTQAPATWTLTIPQPPAAPVIGELSGLAQLQALVGGNIESAVVLTTPVGQVVGYVNDEGLLSPSFLTGVKAAGVPYTVLAGPLVFTGLSVDGDQRPLTKGEIEALTACVQPGRLVMWNGNLIDCDRTLLLPANLTFEAVPC